MKLYFGHACRLHVPDDAPAKRTTFEAEQKSKNQREVRRQHCPKPSRKNLESRPFKTGCVKGKKGKLQFFWQKVTSAMDFVQRNLTQTFSVYCYSVANNHILSLLYGYEE